MVSPDDNGRTGRLLVFRECLKSEIIPLFIEDKNKEEYYFALNDPKAIEELKGCLDILIKSKRTILN